MQDSEGDKATRVRDQKAKAEDAVMYYETSLMKRTK